MHTPVSDIDYFKSLSQDGLSMAEQSLRQDYEKLREQELPIADTVAGLLIVRELQQEVSP